jgi:prephenate dehydrogenase
MKETVPSIKIGVIGCGLIGGSIALSLSKIGHSIFVADKLQNEKKIRKQIPKAAFRKSVGDLCAEKPDVIFICVPSSEVQAVVHEVSLLVSPGTIITDVAGVKQPVMEAASSVVPEGVVFIGGHPMAGSEKSGVEAAQPFLFQNAVYVLTPLRKYDEESTRPLFDAIQQLGARILLMDAAQHDRIAAATSHLPQLLAVELVNLLGDLSSTDEHFNTLAAGGFRDMTRIASSEYTVWDDVIKANRSNIDAMLNSLISRLTSLGGALRGGDDSEIAGEFERARLARAGIRKGGKGFLHPLYDLYVVVEDRVGVLKEITSSLADAGVNIKDIELLKVREGSGGMFRLSFDSGDIQDRAAALLEQHGFQILRKEFEG